MTAPEFGTVALCRSCEGRGGVPREGLDPFDEENVMQCPECKGAGVLPVALADAPPTREFDLYRYRDDSE